MLKRTYLLSVVLLSIIVALPVAAQSQPVFLHLDWVEASGFPLMTVHLSAWDAVGIPLEALLPVHFSLSEDGRAEFAPQAMQADTDAPVWVALVVDISGSMSGHPLDDAKVAAARFLDRLSPGDQAALIAFSDAVDPDPAYLDPTRELGFTADLNLVYDLVEDLEAGGQTQLYNAVAKALGLFQDTPPGHRAVLLLSDGRNEPAEVGDPETPIHLAQEANVPVFVIGLGEQIDLPYLQRLALESGGQFYAVPRSAELADAFDRMAFLLKTQYSLIYTSQLPADGGEHTLRVTLNTSSGQAQTEISFGPLPLLVETPEPPTPEHSSTPVVPTPGQTASPMPILFTETPFPPVGPAETLGLLTNRYAWGGVLLILLGLVWLAFTRRKPAPTAEACARCGYDLTGKSGACPQCGETRRLPKSV